jgi:mannosyl-3-phosphoglycerate phosphatase
MPSLTAAWWSRSNGFASRWWTGHRRNPIESRFSAKRILLFSDPDTLRDVGSRGWAETRTLVSALEDEGIAVVLWGNETRSEMELIQSDLNLHHPFISESGGGLFVGHGYFLDRPRIGRSVQNYQVIDFGRPYYEVAGALREVARAVEIEITGFNDMSIEDVAQQCDLSLSQARLAKLREYDEPFRIVDSGPATYSRICSALRRVGLRCFPHELFHHATGVADKTQSVRTLGSLYREAHHGPVLTVGLAKEPSETDLLQAVDIPVVVQGGAVDGPRLSRKIPTARFVSADGPRGWCEAIVRLVDSRLVS